MIALCSKKAKIESRIEEIFPATNKIEVEGLKHNTRRSQGAYPFGREQPSRMDSTTTCNVELVRTKSRDSLEIAFNEEFGRSDAKKLLQRNAAHWKIHRWVRRKVC